MENRGHDLGISRTELVRQGQRILPIVVGALLLIVLSGIVLVVVYNLADFDVRRLTVDPVAEVGLPSYTGIFTHIGVLLWCSAASVCLFGAAIVWRIPAAKGLSRLLGFLGLFSAVLGLDDLFLLHEEIGRWLSGFLLTDDPDAQQLLEVPVFALYALCGLYCIARFWPVVRKTEFLFLAGAFVSLGLSIGIDIGFYVFPDIAYGKRRREIAVDVAEDLLKLQGILLWLIYVVRTGLFEAHGHMKTVSKSSG